MKGCKQCGKRLPRRNNQANFECCEAGMCRECYENAFFVCQDCGADLPKGRSLKSRAARIMRYCLDCYRIRFPERTSGDVEDVFQPELKEPSDSPWEWMESVRMMYDETDGFER